MRMFNFMSAAFEALCDYMGEHYCHIPTFTLDEKRTKLAGYPIYWASDESAYYCDLGDRLELNLPDGTSVNFWYCYADNESCSNEEPDTSNGPDFGEHFVRYCNPDIVDVFTVMNWIDSTDREPTNTYCVCSYMTGEVLIERKQGMNWAY